MTQSLSAINLHIVFSTKHRTPFFDDPELRVRMHAYIGGIVNNLGCVPITVGGVEDHVHILLRQSRTETTAKLVGTFKWNSSSWVKTAGGSRHFEWQAGYGAFSVGWRDVDIERAYIEGQEEHHRRYSFQEEYRKQLPALTGFAVFCRTYGAGLLSA